MMSSYQEKKFRDKPYTQCFECIQSSRLKCKQCMSMLVKDIMKQKHVVNMEGSCSKAKNKRRDQSRKSKQDSQFMVKTSYGMWMDQVYYRRSRQHQTMSNWPHRKLAGNRKMNKIEGPRFQTWTGRLIARFSNSQQMSKTLQKELFVR